MLTRFHILPITKIGKHNKKGNLGSPYAIRNHYELDELLGEPILDMKLDDQFNALVEACHKAGIKVITEFVLELQV